MAIQVTPFQQQHSAVVSGRKMNIYAHTVPCRKCGTLNRYYSDDQCVRCKKDRDLKRHETDSSPYAKRILIDRMREDAELKKSLEEPYAIRD